MSTLFRGDDPAVDSLLARRRALGLDGRDEVCEGVYHVAPFEHSRNGYTAMTLADLLNARARAAGLNPGGSFSLGTADDFRVPDLGFYRQPPGSLHLATAALVVEVRSPQDQTFAEFDFYTRHGVEELWVVDPVERSVRIWQLGAGEYTETGTSALLDLTAEQVRLRVTWPEG